MSDVPSLFSLRRRATPAGKRAPAPPGLFPWLSPPGTTASKRLARLVRDMNRYGDTLRYTLGPIVVHHLHRPEHIKHVLQDNHGNYVKGPALQKAKIFLGKGLLTSEGDFWLRQRRLCQPAFHRRRLEQLASLMVDLTAQSLDGWAALAASGRPFDLCEELLNLSLHIVSMVLFGSDIRALSKDYAQATTVVIDEANRRALEIVDIPIAIPTPRNRRFRAACAALDRVVLGIIEERRRSGEDRSDLLSMLLAARDEETGEAMGDRQVRDEVMNILLAGHETTAHALAWAFYLLSLHPDAQRRLRAEVDEILGGRHPSFEDLPRLAYTRAIIEEGMRLFPPIWGLARIASGDDEVDGYSIPARSVVAILPYVVHRNPAFWPEPERFDPARFLGPEGARPRFTYLPFGAGPRICIGNHFALMEAQIVLAMIAQRYRVDLAPGAVIEPEMLISLRPRGGDPVTLTRVGAASRLAVAGDS